MDKKKVIRRTVSLSADLHTRDGEGDDRGRYVEGYAILFDTPSNKLRTSRGEQVCEVIDRSAVTKELLDRSDIVLTMFHDENVILGRSINGEGTLSYEVDEKGVYFRCQVPNTSEGDKAYELTRRGDLRNMSFCFSTYYRDPEYVERGSEMLDGEATIVCRVKQVRGIYDFSLVTHPAYMGTSVEVRDLEQALIDDEEPEVEEAKEDNTGQLREMRAASSRKILDF